MIYLTMVGPVQHDYIEYLKQWKLILNGAAPWSNNNAYGPIHNLLAFLVPFGQFAPKLVIVGAMLCANILLFSKIITTPRYENSLLAYFLFIQANFLIVCMGVIYGLNDALVAAFVVAALLARFRGYLFFSGALLGLAVLLKYYPLVLIPLFALENCRFRWRLVLGGATVIALGVLLATWAWGPGFLHAMAFGADRRAKLLSILAALSSYPFLVGGKGVVHFLIATNALVVVAVAAASVAVAMRASLHWLEASVLGFLAVLLSYKVGHQQFYIPWLFLVAALPLSGARSSARLAWLCLPFALFLSAFQWGYSFGSDGYRETLGVVRDSVGFLAFGLGVATIVAYFRTSSASTGERTAEVDKVTHTDTLATERALKGG